MSEPKFQVGQLVSVLCFSVCGRPPLHIPKTAIGEIVYLRENERFPNTRGYIASSDGWYYSVPRIPGVHSWVHESGLRPLQDDASDTEYQDQPQTTEAPDTQETVTL